MRDGLVRVGACVPELWALGCDDALVPYVPTVLLRFAAWKSSLGGVFRGELVLPWARALPAVVLMGIGSGNGTACGVLV